MAMWRADVGRGLAVGLGGILVAGISVAFVASPVEGGLFTLGVLVAWLLSPAYGFAAAHLGLIVISGGGSLTEFLVVEMGLVVALVAPSLHRAETGTPVIATLAGLLATLGVLWFGFVLLGSLWVSTVALAALVLVVGYAIDRYTRVRLGLLDRPANGS